MPGNSRWCALNLTQKRRKLERQGPSITAAISCSMYPQRMCYWHGLLSDAFMHEQKEREIRHES